MLMSCANNTIPLLLFEGVKTVVNFVYVDIHFLCWVDFRLVHSHLSGTSDSSRTKSATYSSYCKQTHNFYCNLKNLAL